LGRQISVTVSIGVGVAGTGMSGFEDLLKRADVALYDAKNSGRNRVSRFLAQSE
jgi:diguanylate cyclase (GGDEF)-like protein